ncbi:MAG: 30S ribosomal protein S17e [Nanoarchaeota archaeon]
MGKIKSKLIRRTANTLMKRGVEFTGDFEDNKKILVNTMPSKKIRNQIAGLVARIKKREKSAESNLIIK